MGFSVIKITNGELIRSSMCSTQENMDIIPKKWAAVPFALCHMAVLSTNSDIVPLLVVSKLCHRAFNTTVCRQLGEPGFKDQEDYVYNNVAKWNALINFAGFFPATVIILPLGAMTDLVSKRKILLLPAIASFISCLINLWCSIFINTHVGFLVLDSFVTSIFGENPGSAMLYCTYAASAGRSDDGTLAVTMLQFISAWALAAL